MDDARRHGPYYPPDRLIYATPGTTIRVRRHRRIGAPPDFYRSTETWGPPATTAIYRRTCRARVAATSEAIAALPEVTAAGRGEEECAVCLNDFRAGESLRAMPCSHAFHQQCISEWLRRSAACPLCRHRLPAAALTTEDEEDELEDSEEEDGGGGESG